MNSEDNTTLVTLPQVFDFAMAAIASPIVVDTSPTTSSPMSTTVKAGTSQLLGTPVVITLLMLLITAVLH